MFFKTIQSKLIAHFTGRVIVTLQDVLRHWQNDRVIKIFIMDLENRTFTEGTKLGIQSSNASFGDFGDVIYLLLGRYHEILKEFPFKSKSWSSE